MPQCNSIERSADCGKTFLSSSIAQYKYNGGASSHPTPAYPTLDRSILSPSSALLTTTQSWEYSDEGDEDSDSNSDSDDEQPELLKEYGREMETPTTVSSRSGDGKTAKKKCLTWTTWEEKKKEANKLWAFCISTKGWTLFACWDPRMLPTASKQDFEIEGWWVESDLPLLPVCRLMSLTTKSQAKQQLWCNQVSFATVDMSVTYNYGKCSMIPFMLRILKRDFQL